MSLEISSPWMARNVHLVWNPDDRNRCHSYRERGDVRDVGGAVLSLLTTSANINGNCAFGAQQSNGMIGAAGDALTLCTPNINSSAV
jgi:hypothetical protein